MRVHLRALWTEFNNWDRGCADSPPLGVDSFIGGHLLELEILLDLAERYVRPGTEEQMDMDELLRVVQLTSPENIELVARKVEELREILTQLEVEERNERRRSRE